MFAASNAGHKLILLGDANVGKTALAMRIVSGKFPESSKNSICHNWAPAIVESPTGEAT